MSESEWDGARVGVGCVRGEFCRPWIGNLGMGEGLLQPCSPVQPAGAHVCLRCFLRGPTLVLSLAGLTEIAAVAVAREWGGYQAKGKGRGGGEEMEEAWSLPERLARWAR